MVDIRAEREGERRIGKGRENHNGIICSVFFNKELLEQIHAEAVSRGWSLSRMIRHLCEASIDGIP